LGAARRAHRPSEPTLFEDRLERALAQSLREGNGAAVMVIDIDRFKEINETHGHAAGDAVLRALAERLACTLRRSDTVARLGGDEFGVVLGGIDPDGARESAVRMQDALAPMIDIYGTLTELCASIGIALHPHHGDGAEMLLRRADVALYDAQRAGVSYAIFEAAAASSPSGDGSRPICAASSPVASSACTTPTLGLLAADEFMTLAEESGLGTAICDHLLAEVAPQCASWRNHGQSVRVAVNIDARSLTDPDFPQRVARLLTANRVAPADLELELSESALLTALSRPRHAVFDAGRTRHAARRQRRHRKLLSPARALLLVEPRYRYAPRRILYAKRINAQPQGKRLCPTTARGARQRSPRQPNVSNMLTACG
jgi:diguanylate cyclase (GGDEF)-like protein